jgi:site-specific DNA-methyltransferase (adenine-specific)
MIKLYNDDCLAVMDKLIEEGVKVDAIITDPPYGTTACKWDSVIPLDEMWKRLNKLSKDRTPIVMFSAMPFTAALVNSNIKNYKQHNIWLKNRPTGFQVARWRPMMKTEDIIVFSTNSKRVNYNPQIDTSEQTVRRYASSNALIKNYVKCEHTEPKGNYTHKHPTNVFEFKKVHNPQHHPTQKPVDLLEYLIKTYSNEGDLILDFTMGSGTTGVACKNLNRRFIGIELDKGYFEIAKKRMEQTEL